MKLNDRENVILNALRQCGPGWHDRADLADALGKNKLNPAEITLLDVMADVGKIEKRFAPGKAEHINRWTYRLKA